jgi:hypothetical protein
MSYICLPAFKPSCPSCAATHLSSVLLRSTNLWRSSCTASASLMTAVPSCCVAAAPSPAAPAPAPAPAAGSVDIRLWLGPLLLAMELEAACLRSRGATKVRQRAWEWNAVTFELKCGVPQLVMHKQPHP